ncbi:MAG: hypothetical protein AAGB34_01905 [Planctomycetota bacterium]
MMPIRFFVGVLLAAAISSPILADGLRVVAWNITNYRGGNISDIQAAVYGNGTTAPSMAPDVFLLQEFHTQTSVNDFVRALNTATGSPGDWVAAPFILSRDTENACVYRSSKLIFEQTFQVTKGGPSPLGPRDTDRFDFRLAGYPQSAPGAKLALYGVHLKASRDSDSVSRRHNQAILIRNNLEGTDTNPNNGVYDGRPVDLPFLVAGDFNVYTATELGYQELTADAGRVGRVSNRGQLHDPIARPGAWNNNSFFRYILTQNPAGQMDDRFDQLLISSHLFDGLGIDYQGAAGVPFSSSTWNDPNHSYRAWGNDGSRYNTTLNTTNNQMVSNATAEALITLSDGSGHIPVYLDLVVPAVLEAEDVIDLGNITVGETLVALLPITNAADLDIWEAGGVQPMTTLLSTQSASGAEISIQNNNTPIPAGVTRAHSIDFTPTIEGEVTSTISVNAPGAIPSGLQVTIRANAVTPTLCAGDANSDRSVDVADFIAVLLSFGESGENLLGDANADNVVNVADFIAVLLNFGNAC